MITEDHIDELINKFRRLFISHAYIIDTESIFKKYFKLSLSECCIDIERSG